MKDIDERFWEKVHLEDEIFPENGCMLWKGALNNSGYGSFSAKSTSLPAHSWIYQRLRGPVPEGSELHHICDNKNCVNVDHLELKTYGDHNRLHHKGKFYRNNHCMRGHEMTEDNTYYNGDEKRCCLQCRREYEKIRYAIPPRPSKYG